MSLQGYGLSITLASGWNGRIFTDLVDEDSDHRPTIHMASFALPVTDGTFGAEVIAAMPSTGTFMSLVEYTPDCYLPDAPITSDGTVEQDPAIGTFSDIGIPVLNTVDFDEGAVIGDTSLPAITAAQYPFTAAGRPFVLYVVIGDSAQLASSLATANQILQTLIVSPIFTCEFKLHIAFAQPAPPSTTCTGTGTGVCILARADGGSSEKIPATFTFSGTADGGICIDEFNIDGTITTTLPDGRAVDVPIHLAIAGTVLPNNVGLLSVEDDPISLPATVKLTQSRCDQNSAADVTGAFVALLSPLAPSVVVPASTATASSQGQLAIPVGWAGDGVGQGTLSLFALVPTGDVNTSRRKRVRIARRHVRLRSERTLVHVRLSRRGRRFLSRRRRLRVEAVLKAYDEHGHHAATARRLTIRRRKHPRPRH